MATGLWSRLPGSPPWVKMRKSRIEYNWSGLAQRADLTAAMVNWQQWGDFVAKVGCKERISFGHSLGPTGVDPPILMLSTQLLRYAVHRA